jgi:hypothetical protein
VFGLFMFGFDGDDPLRVRDDGALHPRHGVSPAPEPSADTTDSRKRRAPRAGGNVAEVEPVTLRVHSGDDVADAGPAVEPAVQQSQLGLRRRHEAEADGAAEDAWAPSQSVAGGAGRRRCAWRSCQRAMSS